MIKIACCQYEMEVLPGWDKYTSKIESLVKKAKDQDATILLMPECAGTEAACKKFDTEYEMFTALQLVLSKYKDFYSRLAQSYQVYIQAGTIIEEIAFGKYVNRAYFFSPNGSYDYQDKLQLTEFEKNIKLLQRGNQQKIFSTSMGKIAIAVCYDSEFPEIIRALVRQGVSLILVPSYTTTIAGYHRVSLSCRARAIENQCYLATAFVINKAEISAGVENTYGQAGIYSPADTGFPDDGIIAQGLMNKSMLVIGDIFLDALDKVRENGQVRNFEDARYCEKIGKNEIEIIKL